MAVREQLIVSWQNRSGELANVCRVLSDVGINIEALATAEAGEYGAVRLVVDDVRMARAVFHKACLCSYQGSSPLRALHL